MGLEGAGLALTMTNGVMNLALYRPLEAVGPMDIAELGNEFEIYERDLKYAVMFYLLGLDSLRQSFPCYQHSQ